MITPSPKGSMKSLLSVTRARSNCSLQVPADRAYQAIDQLLISSRCTINSFRHNNYNNSTMSSKCISIADVARQLLVVRTF